VQTDCEADSVRVGLYAPLLWCYSYWSVPLGHSRKTSHIILDLKPENVLIAIDDVESLIKAEVDAAAASATPPPTRLIGVPPSKGRGGNQTPRSDSIYITESQPLPSPSSSFSSTTAIDKWGFGMSKIDNQNGSKPGSMNERAGSTDETAQRISNVSLESSPLFTEKKDVSSSTIATSGPSLLSQQAPSQSSSFMSEQESDLRASVSGRSLGKNDLSEEPTSFVEEKITVKIADLGNGVSLNDDLVNFCCLPKSFLSHVDRTPFYG
jgi:serine/threonine-protein kinase SRPK3